MWSAHATTVPPDPAQGVGVTHGIRHMYISPEIAANAASLDTVHATVALSSVTVEAIVMIPLENEFVLRSVFSGWKTCAKDSVIVIVGSEATASVIVLNFKSCLTLQLLVMSVKPLRHFFDVGLFSACGVSWRPPPTGVCTPPHCYSAIQGVSSATMTDLASDWHGTFTRHNLSILLKTSRELLMFGVNLGSTPDPVNHLSLCFGYCSPQVHWDCNRYTQFPDKVSISRESTSSTLNKWIDRINNWSSWFFETFR